MSELQNQCDVDVDKPTEESPNQQLANKITEELVSGDFVTEARMVAIANKIATGQMGAENWRTIAASVLRPQKTKAENANDIEGKGDAQR